MQSLQPAPLTCRCDCWYSASLADNARASARSSSSCVLLRTAVHCVHRPPPSPWAQCPKPFGAAGSPVTATLRTAKGREQLRITLAKPGAREGRDDPAVAGSQHPGPRRTTLTPVCETGAFSSTRQCARGRGLLGVLCEHPYTTCVRFWPHSLADKRSENGLSHSVLSHCPRPMPWRACSLN